MPKETYLCPDNLRIFKKSSKLIFSDYLKRSQPMKGVINVHALEECFIRAQRTSRYYNMHDGQLSPYKEVALVAYYIKQLLPFRLMHEPNLWDKVKNAANSADRTIRGRAYTLDSIKTDEQFNINAYVAYIFCRVEIGAIQKAYIKTQDVAYQETLNHLRESNFNRINSIEKSISTCIREFNSGPIEFASMIEVMLMIDEYQIKTDS